MITLLLSEIKDAFILENFKRIQVFLDNMSRFNPDTVTGHAEYTDNNRPMTGLRKGDTIYNSDDSQLNIWDGSQWTFPDGTAT